MSNQQAYQDKAKPDRLGELTRELQTIAHIGGWEIDVLRNTVTWTEGTYRIFDTSPEQFTPTAESTRVLYHETAWETVRASYTGGEHPPERHQFEIQMRTLTGRPIWVLSMGYTVWQDGRAVSRTAIVQDITKRKAAEAALVKLNADLLEKTNLLHTTLNNISQGIFLLNADKRIIGFNTRVCELLKVPADYLASRPTLGELSALQHQKGDFGQQASLVTPEARDYVNSDGMGAPPDYYVRETTDGRVLEVKSRIIEDGSMVRTFADVTDYVRTREALHSNEERWKLALESTGDGVWDWHIPSGDEFFSKNLLQMYGLTEDTLNNTAAALDARTHPDDLPAMLAARQAHFDGLSASYVNEHRVRCEDGSWKWVLTRGMVIARDAQGQPLRMIGTHTDITERKAAEATIWQQAHFDALTGLPNRRLMRERLTQELKKCRRDGLRLALLFIDLDHFKEVNDTLGHDRGDVLLAQAAQRISDCLREVDTVARMGGDEFTVIISELKSTKNLEVVLQKLLTALGAAFQLGQDQVFVSASVGVTFYPDDAQEIEDLLKNADQALYVAKDAGRNRFSFFTPALQEVAQRRAQLTRDLRVALAEQTFQVFYQPIVELATGTIHKAEALLRWQHPTRGAISPAEFIPVAEASGLIVPLGEWVFQQAANQVQAWRQTLHPQFQISVNKSPVQFENPDPQATPWIDQLRARGLSGDCIVAEITEGLLLSTSDDVVERLLALRDDGIQVSLDDFGTGYSSLAYLQKFDIDFIKIDQSFVRHLVAGSTDLALCQAIIFMAHALGMQVIAEGVETEQQRALLAQAGCDFGQGYLFSRPVPANEFAQLHDRFTSYNAALDWSI